MSSPSTTTTSTSARTTTSTSLPSCASSTRYLFTDRTHGDLAWDSTGVAERRRAVLDVPWTWLRQVHGAEVVAVDAPGSRAGTQADAAVTATPGVPLAVQAADCAPVVLRCEGAVGVLHSGWRGIVAGVVPAAVEALRTMGREPVTAVIGPCIRARCYAFGPADLEEVVAVVGGGARSHTADGSPALDLSAAVGHALLAAGVSSVQDSAVCTACSPLHFSHRARADTARHAAVVWLAS